MSPCCLKLAIPARATSTRHLLPSFCMLNAHKGQPFQNLIAKLPTIDCFLE